MKRHPLFHRLPAIPAILSAAVCLASVNTGGGNTDHTPRDFDRLGPAVSFSRSAISSIDSTRRIASINPASFITEDDNEARIYIEGDTVSYVQFATKHRFLLHSDTLSYMGFENRATLFSIDMPFAAVNLAMNEADTVKDRWTGRAIQYGSTVLKATRGKSTSYVDRGWTLVADGDTVHGATRVIWDLDMEYVNPDSIPANAADSIKAETVSDLIVDVDRLLTERLLTRRELWFADDARYPVLQRSTVSRIGERDEGDRLDTIPRYQVSMYYPVSWQLADTGEEPRKSPAGENRDVRRQTSYDEESALHAGEPVADSEAVTLTVSSENGDKDATVTLYSDSGIRLTEPVTVTLTAVPRTLRLPLPTGWKGVLLIRVEAGADSLTRKTVI